ncbi:hypothetical protein L195_g038562 [Trifolium pratense]|uniref:Uncharacterized protein n=1 Tax=Trifolium pratense TaxID=57577 RepID=A0A2K3LVJ0_TRIPR|nr:hypothetical protein L195_g038562 [Trifolium pratense]
MWSRNRSRSSGSSKSNTCLAFGVTRPNKDENGRGEKKEEKVMMKMRKYHSR